ncbi:hypothetical protein STRDD11_01853 [Streptococcus sp. DD11]|nr:hypothetical protein STRDD11_01853 [Streptococcus sp. DD11]
MELGPVSQKEVAGDPQDFIISRSDVGDENRLNHLQGEEKNG